MATDAEEQIAIPLFGVLVLEQTLQAIRRLVDDLVLTAPHPALRSASDAWSETLLDQAQVGVFFADESGHILYSNKEFAELTECTGATGSSAWLDIAHSMDRTRLAKGWAAARKTGETFQAEFPLASGTDAVARVTVRPVEVDGALSGFVGTVDDLTGNRRALVNEEKLDILLENSDDLIALFAPTGAVIHLNSPGKTILGLQQTIDLTRVDFRVILDPKSYNRVFNRTGGLHSDVDRVQLKGTLASSTGVDIPFEGRVLMVNAPTKHDKPVAFLIARDMTAQKAVQAELTYRASHDPLTGLANRRRFMERLEKALITAGTSSKTVGVLFLDLDGFKLVNDTQGHLMGDELLRQVGERLNSVKRSTDLLARFGGDEFVVLIPNCKDADEVRSSAQRLCGCLIEPFDLDGRRVAISVSIGAASATGPFDNVDAETLLREADHAMYQAKGAGRSCVRVFDATAESPELIKQRQEQDLRRGVLNGEIHFELETLVDLATWEPLGKLIDPIWNHPTRGQLAASQFQALAEETRLIIPIGATITKLSLASMVATSGKICLKVTTQQLEDPGFSRFVLDQCKTLEMDPTRLVVHLKEETIQHGKGATEEELHSLVAAGVTLAIAEFGSYLAAVSSITKYPISQASLSSRLWQPGRDLLELRGLLGLLGAIGVQPIASGLDSTATVAQLVDFGIEIGHGPLFTSLQSAPR